MMNRARPRTRLHGGSKSAHGAKISSLARGALATVSEEIVAAGAGLVERIRALEERQAALLEENRGLNEAIHGAAQLQRMLSPPREVRRGRWEIVSEIFPARHLSGDFYDVQDGAETLNLAVGDIAGKGLAASLWFTYLVGLIRMQSETLDDPASVADAANRELTRFCEAPPLAALFAARLDPRSGELAYCNAGQPSAILIRHDHTVESLYEGGPILGAITEARFTNGVTALSPGDTLIIYSDGIPECRNERDEEFGSHRLLAAALEARGSSASAVLFSILGAAQDFAGSCAQSDDLTLMVIHHR